MSLINLESLTSFRLVHLEEEHLFVVLLRPPPHALLPPVGSAFDHKDALGAGPGAVRERHLHLLVVLLRRTRDRKGQGDVTWGESGCVSGGIDG